MTKKELKQEAETEYRKQEERCKHSWNGAIFQFGYLAGAVPREKQLVELKKQHLDETLASKKIVQGMYKQIQDLQKEVEYQTNDCKKWQGMYKNRCKEYQTLEKENTELKDQLAKANLLLEDVYNVAMDNWNDPKWHDQVLKNVREYLKEVKENER